MKTTMTLASSMGCSPFEIFNQDTDEVIMMINYYIALSDDEEETNTQTTTSQLPVKKKEQRIRVNDATATGGWY